MSEKSVVFEEVLSGIELHFRPNHSIVPEIRTFVSALAEKSEATEEWLEKIEVTAHELVENAVKGAARGQVRVRVELRKNRQGDLEFELRTWNRASRWDLACLQKIVGEVAAAKDPSEFYVALLKRTVGQEGSGLGIGRVRAEAGMKVECAVIGDEACVVARGRQREP